MKKLLYLFIYFINVIKFMQF